MTIHLEDVIEQTGGCGRYQVLLSLSIHLTKTISCFSMVFMVFGGASPDWWCADGLGGNVSDPLLNLTTDSPLYKTCSYTIDNSTRTCDTFIFADTINSVINEWNIVCDKSWVSTTITSIQMAGVLVGNVACGHIADLIGRKLPLYGGVLALTILNLTAIFSTSWIMFAVIRFFIGVGMAFQLTAMYSLQSEFTLARWRSWVVAVPSWAIQTCLFALTAWLCKDWKYIHAVTAITGIPLMLTFWFVPESFRWRVAHDQIKEANDIIGFMAKVNRKQAPRMHELQELADTIKKESEEKDADRKYTVVDILRNKRLLVSTLLMTVVWISLGIGGYGIQFGVPALSGNLYINIFMIGLLGSPLQFVVIFLQNRFGRKKAAILFYTIYAVCAAVVGLGHRFKVSSLLNTVMNGAALVSLTAINASWSPVQTLTLELYPTVVRNIGYGMLSTMARVGAVIGPQLVFMDTHIPGIMYIICTVVGVISIICILPLPETGDRDLNDKISTTDSSSSQSYEDDMDTETMKV